MCAFLDLDVDPEMVDWFNMHVTPENAHVGRWRNQFDSTTADQIDEYYERICRNLVSDGVRIPA
jgi:hypothetical protein